jgi:hypothetical protein
MPCRDLDAQEILRVIQATIAIFVAGIEPVGSDQS